MEPKEKINMTDEQAKAMLGTEFTYIYQDGDTIRAYVKAYDPEVGLTCWTLENKTKSGWVKKDRPKKSMDSDGTYCIAAFDFKTGEDAKEKAFERLEEILTTGVYDTRDTTGSGYSPACSFI